MESILERKMYYFIWHDDREVVFLKHLLKTKTIATTSRSFELAWKK
jgi:hypothetical protein